MGCRTSFARLALFAVNLFVWIGGIAIFATGVWLLNELKDNEEDKDGKLKDLVSPMAAVAVVIGVVIVIVGLAGCFGAWQEHVVCLKTYLVLLSIIVVLELVLAILAIVFGDKIESKVESDFLLYVSIYNVNDEVSRQVDYIQHTLQCCGSIGPDDWDNSQNITSSMYDVPSSCCKPVVECVRDQGYDTDTIYQMGCTDRLIELATRYLGAISCVCFVILVCQIIAITVAFFLIRAVQDKPKV